FVWALVGVETPGPDMLSGPGSQKHQQVTVQFRVLFCAFGYGMVFRVSMHLLSTIKMAPSGVIALLN
ncbi:hypothetical protein, partial [Natronospirillum operosum]|uniref:hypothetical protein n=1 Tax=Natronospirillum operosum TaxID=2759953 RepID=UPI00197BC778